jgi:protease IV
MRGTSRTWLIIIVGVILVLGCACCSLVVMFAVLAPSLQGTSGLNLGGAVAVIDVKGVIVGGKSSDGFGTSGQCYSADVIRDIQAASKDASVKAIVLDIDSPGGSVVASVDIYRALMDCKKPIVTSMGAVAASGGYYVACPSRQILVRPATITGSIGVISEFINAQKLIEKLGVEMQIVKSGKHKDEGGWHRPLNEEELAMYQALIDEAYNDFVGVVALGRNLPEEKVRALADGRIYSGRQAISLGLADAEGDLEQAIKVAGELGGIKGEPRVVHYARPVSFLGTLGGMMQRINRPVELTLLSELLGAAQTPTLQYLYTAP